MSFGVEQKRPESQAIEAARRIRSRQTEYEDSLRELCDAINEKDLGYGVESTSGLILPETFSGRGACGVGAEIGASYLAEQFPELHVTLRMGLVEVFNPGAAQGKKLFHIWFDIHRMISVDMAARQFDPKKQIISTFLTPQGRLLGYHEEVNQPIHIEKFPGLRFLGTKLFEGKTPEADQAYIKLLEVFK